MFGTRTLSWSVLCAILPLLACRNHMPHAATWPAGGVIERSYARPPGCTDNWDPFACSVDVTPAETVNGVGTQQVLVATVRDKNGRPLPNRRVEWILASGGVGDFVEVDSNGWLSTRGYKVTNNYAVTHTRSSDGVLTMGTSDPSDDIRLCAGQTWVVISSLNEGETRITAYAPGIYDWNKHKVFVTQRWYDVHCEFPQSAVNPLGTQHGLVTRVTRHSDGTPLAGYDVSYRLVDGPAGRFTPDDRDSVTAKTDAKGEAHVTLQQPQPAEGTNTIRVEVTRPGNDQCCQPSAAIGSGTVTKTWAGPRIEIQKNAPAHTPVNEPFMYTIVVTNPALVRATDLVVTDTLPDGVEYISSSPSGKLEGHTLSWTSPSLAGGATWTIAVTAKGTRTGAITNCAEVHTGEGLSAKGCADTRVPAASLVLEKTCTAEALACEPIEHTIIVRNTGDTAARNVRVVDELPDGMATQEGRSTLVFDAGTIEPGQARQARFTAFAKRSGKLSNRATATGDGGLKAEATCETIVRQPVLSVASTAPGERYVGRAAVYELTVTNKGDATARNTMLTAPIPQGSDFVEADAGGRAGGGLVNWSLGDIEPGGFKKVKLTLNPTTVGAMRLTATVKAVCAESQTSAETAIRGIPAVALEMDDTDDPVEIGETTTYVITVTNQGSSPSTSVKIVCTVPPQGEAVSGDGPTRSTISGATVTFEPLPSLAPKERVTYRVVVRAKAAGDVRFKVSLTTGEITTPVEETESTHMY
jgi:uncharacterized repeat protein (TIGR01451 family)